MLQSLNNMPLAFCLNALNIQQVCEPGLNPFMLAIYKMFRPQGGGGMGWVEEKS